MKDLLNAAKDKAGALVTTGVEKARKMAPEADDLKRTAHVVVDSTIKAAHEVAQLGKEAMKTDMAKDAAAGAGIGAILAVPIPGIGPVAGAVVGAGLGVYKSIRHGSKTATPEPLPDQIPDRVIDVESKVVTPTDKFDELSKLHDLKVRGILTEEEFAVEKKKVLDR
jgi:hypothetical protein